MFGQVKYVNAAGVFSVVDCPDSLSYAHQIELACKWLEGESSIATEVIGVVFSGDGDVVPENRTCPDCGRTGSHTDTCFLWEPPDDADQVSPGSHLDDFGQRSDGSDSTVRNSARDGAAA